MPTSFPSSLDSFGSVQDTVDTVLAAHVNDLRRAVEAVETKVGVDGSPDPTSLDAQVTGVAGLIQDVRPQASPTFAGLVLQGHPQGLTYKPSTYATIDDPNHPTPAPNVSAYTLTFNDHGIPGQIPAYGRDDQVMALGYNWGTQGPGLHRTDDLAFGLRMESCYINNDDRWVEFIVACMQPSGIDHRALQINWIFGDPTDPNDYLASNMTLRAGSVLVNDDTDAQIAKFHARIDLLKTVVVHDPIILRATKSDASEINVLGLDASSPQILSLRTPSHLRFTSENFTGPAGIVAEILTYGNDYSYWSLGGQGLSMVAGGAFGLQLQSSGAQKIGVFGATPVTKPTVTGSRGGNAALASLLTALAGIGWITDGSSA